MCLIILIFTGISSDQRSCNIYSPSLTTNGEVMSIAIGTQNVILYCICRRGTIAVGPAIWFMNDTRVTLTTADGSGNPYSRDNVPAPLIIPSFTATSAGAYSCQSTGIEQRVTINLLAISGMCNYNS